jgi:hypothetical protein
VSSRREQLASRLGGYRVMSGPELDQLAEATEGQALEAVFYGIWRRRGWLGAATDTTLYLVRRPKLFGRRQARTWQWSALRAVRAKTQAVDLDFGEELVELRFMAPHDEFVALLEVARGPAETSSTELRELARVKLGKTLAFGYEATIDALPDRLEPDERVERLAIGTLEFTGMLVVTDRRLLLVDRGLRAERFWETPRDAIRGLSLTEGGFRLALESGEVSFSEILPLDRRDELAAVLRP